MWNAACSKVIRRGAYNAADVADADCPHGRVRQLAYPYAHIHSLLDQIDDPIKEHRRYGHVRKTSQIFDDAGRHEHAAKQYRSGDGKLAARLGMYSCCGLVGLIGLSDDAPGMLQVAEPRIGCPNEASGSG